MRPVLHLLMVEDVDDDAVLIRNELERAGYKLHYRRVETEAQMRNALQEHSWDLVLSDYGLPNFSGMRALEVLREMKIDIPLVIVSGTIGEETAVDAMRAGAHDYLVKGLLGRLVPAVERELREAKARASQRMMEAALAESEARFRALIESFPESVVMLRQHRIAYLNPEAVRALGAPDGLAWLGERAEIFITAPDLARLEQYARSNHSTLNSGIELRWTRADGTTVTVEAIARMLILNGEEALVVVGRDVTERKAVQAQLITSDRMASIGMLAAGVAHEINNPLAAALANVVFARNKVKETLAHTHPELFKELNESLQDSEQAMDRVRAIVTDLKVFSRSSEEQQSRTDVQRVVESSIRMAWNEIRHRARLNQDFQPVPPVLASESRLGQVFLNLLVNAAQAIPEGHAEEHRITVSIRQSPEGEVVTEIADTGHGMGPEIQAKLFQPFFTTKSIGVGTGLGLSISQRIVKELGGQMRVHSAPGKGSTFSVVLPAAPPAHAPNPQIPVAAVSTPPHTRAEARGKVLVIDDDPLIAIAVKRTLSKEHDVTCLANAKEALDRLKRGETFDGILCDLMMPEMTGIELYRELSSELPDVAGRIIFLTGGAFTDEAIRFLADSPNRRVNKPFDIDDLRAVMRQSVDETLKARGLR